MISGGTKGVFDGGILQSRMYLLATIGKNFSGEIIK